LPARRADWLTTTARGRIGLVSMRHRARAKNGNSLVEHNAGRAIKFHCKLRHCSRGAAPATKLPILDFSVEQRADRAFCLMPSFDHTGAAAQINQRGSAYVPGSPGGDREANWLPYPEGAFSRECPFLARTSQPGMSAARPLSGAIRTLRRHRGMTESDVVDGARSQQRGAIG